MGIIRLLLAAAVVMGHAQGWGIRLDTIGRGLISPYYAVQLFFVISGFYMALIYERYAGLPFTFYVNRYSRLIVTYWIVAAVTIFFIFHQPWKGELLEVRHHMGEFTIPLVLTNLFLFGQDTVAFFWIDGKQATDWLLIPPGWSLGIELWFYLLVPLLAPMRVKTLLAVLCASVLLRTILMYGGVPHGPWAQRFFPSELAFFTIGMLSYRFYVAMKPLPQGLGAYCLVAAVAILMFTGNLERDYYGWGWNSFLFAGAFFLLLPPIFDSTKDASWDRLIGEFSYPVYLWHAVIGAYSRRAQTEWDGWYLLGAAIVFSIPVVFLVERPMERWRSRRLKAARWNRATSPALYGHASPLS